MDEGIDALIDRVDQLTRLVAIGIVVGRTQREQVDLLSRAGFQPKEIAGLLGTTANPVRVTLSTMRRQNNKKAGRGREKESENG